MLIVYDSLTGNVKRFVEKLGIINKRIEENLIVNEPYILITYTFGLGNPPVKTMEFLKSNHKHLKGVVSSGNRNFGNAFCKSADIISNLYNVPIIHKFELAGSNRDVELVKQEVMNIDRTDVGMD